jgi:hypothetical protein
MLAKRGEGSERLSRPVDGMRGPGSKSLPWYGWPYIHHLLLNLAQQKLLRTISDLAHPQGKEKEGVETKK